MNDRPPQAPTTRPVIAHLSAVWPTAPQRRHDSRAERFVSCPLLLMFRHGGPNDSVLERPETRLGLRATANSGFEQRLRSAQCRRGFKSLEDGLPP